MRVLHVWNTAGVASILAKHQRKLLNWDTWVIYRRKYDRYGFTVYGELSNLPSILFYLKTLIKAVKFNVIHIHDIDRIIPFLRSVYGSKKIIIHYHGSSIRGRWREKEKYWSKADMVFVSTKDLYEEAPSKASVYYIPNPVDTDIFKPIKMRKVRKGALFIYDESPKLRESLNWARTIASKYGLKLYIHYRNRTPIPYTYLPIFLNKFEYFIDHTWVPALSKTALEALACGLNVIRWDNKVISGLPHENKPEYPVRLIAELLS